MLQKEVEIVYALQTEKGYIFNVDMFYQLEYTHRIEEAMKYGNFDHALIAAKTYRRTSNIPIEVIPKRVRHAYEDVEDEFIRKEFLVSLLEEIESKEEISKKTMANMVKNILSNDEVRGR